MCNLFNLFKRKKKYESVDNYPQWYTDERYLIHLVNAYRISKGLSVFQRDKNLHLFARIRANEISDNFSHDGFYDHVKDITDLGLSSPKENLAVGYEETFALVDAWINSPTHRKVLLSRSKYAGVGYCNKGQKGYYCLILAR